MKVALASPRPAVSFEDALERVRRLTSEAADRGAGIVCFPEAYVPGLRGQEFAIPPYGPAEQEAALEAAGRLAAVRAVAIVLGIERIAGGGRQVAAAVVDRHGAFLGWQTKNQLDPTEDPFYVPGNTRRVFESGGLRFGIAICHEGFRYPETVRWAAARGAQIVFHPHMTGSDRRGVRLTGWGDPAAPYYEKAMAMRALENTVWFASVNYATRFPESPTAFFDPAGRCRKFLPYGEEGVLVEEIDLDAATGLLASRWAPERHREEAAE
jgi:predicted amidohydrolase